MTENKKQNAELNYTYFVDMIKDGTNYSFALFAEDELDKARIFAEKTYDFFAADGDKEMEVLISEGQFDKDGNLLEEVVVETLGEGEYRE